MQLGAIKMLERIKKALKCMWKGHDWHAYFRDGLPLQGEMFVAGVFALESGTAIQLYVPVKMCKRCQVVHTDLTGDIATVALKPAKQEVAYYTPNAGNQYVN